jgi:hypothetical protein
MARRLVVVMVVILVVIPIGIIQRRGLDISTRIRPLGRRIPCHCLSVPALIVRLIAVKATPVNI